MTNQNVCPGLRTATSEDTETRQGKFGVTGVVSMPYFVVEKYSEHVDEKMEW